VTHGSCEVVSVLINNKRTLIEEHVVKAAAGNEETGKEVMMLLLEQRGADVVITEEVVKAAAGNWGSGKELMILLLEQRGADVMITEDVIAAAATSGQEEVLRFITEHLQVSPSKEQRLVAQFYNAAKSGIEDTIQRLLEEGVEPDLKNPYQISPLWIAAAKGHTRVVQLLLGTKLVSVNSKSISRRPPIFWAAANGYEDVVGLLLEAGADPSVMDKDGQTPLSMATRYGHAKIAKMLSGE